VTDNGPPTPKITGSLAIADGMHKECVDLADALEQLAIAGARLAGRPDLARRRVALRLRDVARRVRSWHQPPPGHAARTAGDERQRDYQDAATWLAEGRALLPPKDPPTLKP